MIANHVPGQVALHGPAGQRARLLSLSIHGGSAAAPGGVRPSRSRATDGTLAITPARPGALPGLGRMGASGSGAPTAAGGGPAGPRPLPSRPGRGARRPGRAHIAALYREIAQAITGGRPAHPGFDTAVHHHPDARGHRAGRPDRRPPSRSPSGPDPATGAAAPRSGRGEGSHEDPVSSGPAATSDPTSPPSSPTLGTGVSALHRARGAPPPPGALQPRRRRSGRAGARSPPAAAGYDRVIHAGAPIDDGNRPGPGAESAARLRQPGALHHRRRGPGRRRPGRGPARPTPQPDRPPAGPPSNTACLRAGGWVIRPGMVYGDGGGLVHGLLTAKSRRAGAPASTSGRPAPGGQSCTSTTWPRSTWPSPPGRPPGTIWHGASETVRLDGDRSSTRRRHGPRGWPVSEASAETRPARRPVHPGPGPSQPQRPRAALGWAPACTSIVKYLTA